MEFDGLPLHPLVIHAVVTLVPLAALVALGFAVLPAWRDRLRWPLVALAVLAPVLVQVAVVSGNALLKQLGLNSPAVVHHHNLGLRTRLVVLGFAVVALAAAWLLRTPRPAVPLEVGLAGLLVVASLGLLVMVFLTGEAGARAVWG